jgi:hypothetical protein
LEKIVLPALKRSVLPYCAQDFATQESTSALE